MRTAWPSLRGTRGQCGLLPLAALLASCATDPAALAIDIRTDLVAGDDFTMVRTTAQEGAGEPRTAILRATDQSFRTGARIAEFDDVRTASTHVRVELLDSAGNVTAQRSALIAVHPGWAAVTFVVTRECGSDELCDAACRSSSDCDAPGCGTATCDSGLCVRRGDEVACGGEPDGPAPCDPDNGCRLTSLTSVEPSATSFVCKLISGDEREYESANRTHTRFNLTATDRGAPAVVGDDLHFFFGDSHGRQTIWRPGEDPDSVAHVDLEGARADLEALCSQLEFYVTEDDPSLASVADPSILRDFEGTYLHAPPGESIRDYIDRPVPFFETETSSFAGTAEVPSGALGTADGAYVFWASRSGQFDIGPMRRSFVARWDRGPRLTQQILYAVDDVAWDRLLGGHFVHTAPVEHDGYLYLFGAGETRRGLGLPGVLYRDGVHLARKPIRDLETPGGFQLYDVATGHWVAAAELSSSERVSLPALLENEEHGVYELGAQYVESVGLFAVMYHHVTEGSSSNRVRLATATRPEGPWVQTDVLTPSAAEFQARHCCEGDRCAGDRFLRCERAGVYAAYPLPLIGAEWTDGGVALDVPFVLSSMEPRNVVLLRAQVVVRGE